MTIRLAISGTGYISMVHAAAIKRFPDVELVAVVGHTLKRTKEFAKTHGIPHICSNVEELVKTQQIDGVVIATPNAFHAPQAITALKAGVAVLVEKPMSMNTREARKMKDACETAKKPLMVAHCWRFDNEVNWLKKQADDGKLGRILRTKGYGVHANWGPAGWFIQKKWAGGGAMADMGIHAVDTARYLMNDPIPVSVYARVGRYYIKGDVDDTGVILVNWNNGAVSYIESGWWQPHVDGPESATQLYGTKGFGSIFPTLLELPNKKTMQVDEVKPGFPYPRLAQAPQGMYDRQMAAFIDAIKEQRMPKPGAMEGYVNMQIIGAAYRSAATGKVVNVVIED
jgi:predicted dehydrogenase